MNNDYKPKLSVEITEEQQQGLRSINLPHGFQKALFSAIIDDLLSINATHGPMPLSLIIAGKIESRTIIPSMAQSLTNSAKLST